MVKEIKRIVSVFLAVAMVITFMPVSNIIVQAAEEDTLVLGNFDTDTCTFKDATGTGTTQYCSLTIMLAGDPSGTENVTLPTVDGFSLNSSLTTTYSKVITCSNKTTLEIADYIKQIVFSGCGGQTVKVDLSVSPVDNKTVYFEKNGHYYQYVKFSGSVKTWTEAYEMARNMYYAGRQGYLVTITSLEEDLYVYKATGGAVGWLGGTILNPGTQNGQYYESFDTYGEGETAKYSSSASTWYWACGPEIGQTFFDTVENDNSTDRTKTSLGTTRAEDWERNANENHYYFNWATHGSGGDNLGEPNKNGFENCLTTLALGYGYSTESTLGSGYSWNNIVYNRNENPNYTPQGFVVEYGDQTVGDSGHSATGLISSTITLPPDISGIESDKTYCQATEFTVTGLEIASVKMDGVEMTATDGKYTLPADGAVHTITASYTSGRTTTISNVKANNGHDWQYAAGTGDDLNKLYAYCKNDCCYHGSASDLSNALVLSLNANSTKFTGKTYTGAGITDQNGVWASTVGTLPSITYYKASAENSTTESGDALTLAPSLLGNYVAEIAVTKDATTYTAKKAFSITADVDYKNIFNGGISGGHNWDADSGRSIKCVDDDTTNTLGVTWDETEQCAVFDGEAYYQIDNPLGDANADTGFTISLDAYVSSENSNTGTFYDSKGNTAYKNGWQRLFDLSSNNKDYYFMINAGSGKSTSDYGNICTEAKYVNKSRMSVGDNVAGVTKGTTYFDAWHNYTLVVAPGGNETLYIDGNVVAYKAADDIILKVLNDISKYNICYIGTSIYEALGAVSDGFFYGKIRGMNIAEGTLLPSYDASGNTTYTVKYETNGGSAISSQQLSKLPDTLPITTKADAEFLGWYLDSDFTTTATAGATLTENVTLYAKWHDHTFSTEWSKDATNHWRVATCEHTTLVKDKAAHTYGDVTYTWLDDNKKCLATKTCTVCGYESCEVVDLTTVPTPSGDPTGDDPTGNPTGGTTETPVGNAKVTTKVTKAATCTTAGTALYTVTFEDSSLASTTKTIEIPATGHDWGTWSYIWSDDKKTCTAKRTCKNDSSHVESYVVQTDTDDPGTGGTSGNPTGGTSGGTSGGPGTGGTSGDPDTGNNGTITSKVTKAATCTEAGIRTYTATFTKTGYTTTSTGVIPATGHDFSGEWVVTKEATATTEGTKEKTCKNGCGTKKYATIPATGQAEDDSSNGNLDKEARVAEDAPVVSASLDNTKTELMDASGILTESEKAQIKNGQNATIYLQITNIDKSDIATEDQSKLETAAVGALGETKTIEYMDVSLFKQIGSSEAETVHEPGTDIDVTLEIPSSMLVDQKGMVRKYRVLRLHDGVVEVIKGTFNYDTNEFTFATDRFSTYAIAYSDEKEDIVINLPGGDGGGGTTITEPGGTIQLDVKVTPEDDANQKVKFTSSNDKVATVSDTGLITAVGEGSADITVTTADGAVNKSITITVDYSGAYRVSPPKTGQTSGNSGSSNSNTSMMMDCLLPEKQEDSEDEAEV